jgi:hypothetical protein
MTNNQHFFANFFKTKVWYIQNYIFKFQNKYTKYNLCYVFVRVTQQLKQKMVFHKCGYQISTILIIIKKTFFGAIPFINYFVLYISYRYNI